MQFSALGSSGESVSRVCLGSMTWGIQNTQADADAQINFAAAQGINFMDTAEMYPIPPSADTSGDTERVIGDYFARHPHARKDWLIATKIVGPGFPYIREASDISAASIEQALMGSLQRLQSDYVDLYQLHWPNRTSPHFGKHSINQVKSSQTDVAAEKANMIEIVRALDNAIKEGQIRFWGLSDDTPWGIHTFLSICDEYGFARPVSIQNEFNLLHTKDWPYLIESCVFEDIAYLPWSPLAGGMLSGKYLDGARPQGSRWTLAQRMGLFRNTPHSEAAIKAYIGLALDFGMTPSQLALAWCDQVDGVTSTIIGATTMAQLDENIQAFARGLTVDEMQAVNAVWTQYPAPF